MKTCPICRKTFTGPGAKASLRAHMASAHPGSQAAKQPKRARGGAPRAGGTTRGRLMTTVSNAEMISVVEVNAETSAVKTFMFWPGKTGCAALDTTSALYSNYRIRKLRFMIRNTVSSVRDGYYIAGVDYDATDATHSVRTISALQPKTNNPIYRPGSLNINPRDAMKATWHFNANNNRTATDLGAALIVALFVENTSNTKSSVALWWDYTIELMGPEPPSLTSEAYFYNSAAWEAFDGTTISQIPLKPGFNNFEILMDSKNTVTQAKVEQTIEDFLKNPRIKDLQKTVREIKAGAQYAAYITFYVEQAVSLAATTLADWYTARWRRVPAITGVNM